MNGITASLQELIALKQVASDKTKKLKAKRQTSGLYTSHVHGRGMIFSELRAYQPGDDIRHMEWRVTARTGKPHIKLYQEERECPVLITVDFNPSMYFGTRVAFKSVIAARLAAIIAWTASAQGDRVGGLLMSLDSLDEFIPRTHNKGVLPYLARLSALTEHENFETKLRPLSDALSRLVRVIKPATTLVLISDFYGLDDKCKEYLSMMGKNCNVIFYHIMDPLEINPPKPGQYVVSDGYKEALLDTQDKKIQTQYTHHFETKRLELRALCGLYKIQYIPISSLEDLAHVVLKTFPRRQDA